MTEVPGYVQTMAVMGQHLAESIPTEELHTLPAGSVVIRAKYGTAYQSKYYDWNHDRIEWSEADYGSRTWRTSEGMVEDYAGEWWIVIWKGQTCLQCGSFGTHKFVALEGPDGWLCEEHKDDPVEVAGVTYGEKERRDS